LSVAAEGAPQQTACSTATLAGHYSLRATGEVVGVGAVAIVGVFDFDGRGHVTGSVTTRTSGVNTQSDVQGVYSVSVDCFATDTLKAANGAISTHEYVIFENGRGYFVLNTTTGAPNVVIGEAFKQTRRKPQNDNDR
jgi:hypothetical protein